ncbi:MAG: hypothetical protein KUG79_16695 [Pseudomonadales bacterium]|nr:hypothetical protein [Pseudomonadales bacterium]
MASENAQLWLDRIDDISLREKVLIAGTVVVSLVIALQLILIEPLSLTAQKVNAESQTLNQLNRGLVKQLENSPGKRIESQKAEVVRKIQVLEAQILALEGKVDEFAAGLVQAKEMPDILQLILAEHSLTLVSMNNIAAEPVVVRLQSADAQDEPAPLHTGLYRHGISLRLKGEYFEVLKYLQKLEAQSGKIIWVSMDYEVQEYPFGLLSIEFQTLSTDQRWLGV